MYSRLAKCHKWTLRTAAIVATLMVSAAVSPVVLAEQGDVGGRPANPDKNNPRSSDIFIYDLKPGGARTDGALVVNNTDKTKTVAIYATDGIASNTGAMTCRQQVEPREAVGSWITLDMAEVTLKPRSKQVVNFTINVPSKVDVGEHNGCIVYQVKDQEAVTQGNLRIQTRSATRVAITIPGKLHKNVDITSLEFTRKDSSHNYELTLKNTGNVSADTITTITLDGLFGRNYFKNSGQYPALPGESLYINYTNDRLPVWGGFYWINGSIRYDTRPGTFGVLDKNHITSKIADRKLVFVMPHVYILIGWFILLVALLTLSFIAYYRHKRREDALRNWSNHTIKLGETIQSIAAKQDVSWRYLAKVNDIKPPYDIKSGDKIKVPKKLPASPRKKVKIQ